MNTPYKKFLIYTIFPKSPTWIPHFLNSCIPISFMWFYIPDHREVLENGGLPISYSSYNKQTLRSFSFSLLAQPKKEKGYKNYLIRLAIWLLILPEKCHWIN